MDISIPLVFLQGFLSFFSPCILPLIPVYLVYFAGQAGLEKNKKRVYLSSLLFIAGFTLVFVILGMSSTFISDFLFRNRSVFNVVFGSMLVIFGAGYLGLFRIAAPGFGSGRIPAGTGIFSSLVLGAALSLGWVPCVGPLLASVLLIASGSADFLYGGFLLFVYSMGIGVPFFAVTVLLVQFSRRISFSENAHKKIKTFSGIILIILGILIFSGRLFSLLQ